MNIQNSILLSRMILLLCLVLGASGCRTASPEDEGRRALAEEIRLREQRRGQAEDAFQRGMVFHEKEDWNKAQVLFFRAVQINEDHAPAWMALGVTEFERNRLFDAAQAFDRVVNLRPLRYEPHYNLGQVFESIGRYGQAIEAYEKALVLAPDRVEVMENLVRCLRATGQEPERARKLVERSLALEWRPEWRQWLRQQAYELEARQVRDVKGETP